MKQSNFLVCSIQLDIPQPVIIINKDNQKVIRANAAAIDLLGYPANVLTTKYISELFTPGINDGLLSGGLHFPSVILKSSGIWTKIYLTVINIKISGIEHLAFLINPFTDEHKQIINDIKQNSLFNILFEKNPLPGIIFGLETGKVLLANDAATDLYGYTEEEFGNLTIENICPELKVPGFLNIAEPLLPGRYYKTIAYHQSKNKNILEVEMHTRLYDFNRKSAVITFVNNISKRNDARLEFAHGRFPKVDDAYPAGRDINTAVDSLSSLKSIILSNMSHELRTPLVGILGYSDILKSEVVNSELKQMADVIHKSGEKLLTDLNMVLNLSAIEIGLTKLFYVEADLCDIILKVINKLKSETDKKHLYINFSSKYKVFPVRTDRELMHDALYYIVDNAIKFTNSGGVNVEIDYLIEDSRQYYIVSISDTGLGISEEQQQLIFEAFRQISEGTNRTFGGLGIGLTVAKKIVMLFGGKIIFTSEMNKGSKFTLYFPTDLEKY